MRNETLALPRSDRAERIAQLEQEQARLVASFKGTTLNLKSFMQLMLKHGLAEEFPSSSAARYWSPRARSAVSILHRETGEGDRRSRWRGRPHTLIPSNCGNNSFVSAQHLG